MNILTLNAGSSSIKYKLFKTRDKTLEGVFSGLIEGIGEMNGKWHHTNKESDTDVHLFKDHQEAFKALASKLEDELNGDEIKGIGHRVVHGGDIYYQPTVVKNEVLFTLEQLSNLAPIHNPINILGIKFAQTYFPNTVQLAVFDTGFHHSMPEASYTYAIDQDIASKYHIRRYGFHGINHEYVARQAAKHLDKKLSECNFISLHLGNGASACLIKQGKSYDTSMGMTPLSGLIMGTRCGDIDPAIPLYLQQQGYKAEEVDELLNRQSGLKGIAGDNDMRHLCQRANENDEAAKLAIEMYVYAIQKRIGSYYSQAADLDALIFTGGVGENAAGIRQQIITPLKHFGLELHQSKNKSSDLGQCDNIASGKTPVLVIKGNE